MLSSMLFQPTGPERLRFGLPRVGTAFDFPCQMTGWGRPSRLPRVLGLVRGSLPRLHSSLAGCPTCRSHRAAPSWSLSQHRQRVRANEHLADSVSELGHAGRTSAARRVHPNPTPAYLPAIAVVRSGWSEALDLRASR